MAATINLKELVQEIRRQLEDLDLERARQGADALFELQGIDLELKFTVGGTDTAKGGFDIKVISAGGESQERSETIQTIKISYRVSPQYLGYGRRAHPSNQLGPVTDEGVNPLK